jgi:hypothetical protein
MASPVIAGGGVVHIERNAPSAALAYNRALDATEADIVVFLHHDVYLPEGWDKMLQTRLDELEARHPDWALAGACGVTFAGRVIGPVWSSSLGCIVGDVPMAPEPVGSFDEMLIVLRRSSGLRFDDKQPGWHLYGTDIVCQARAAGKGAYAVGLPCIHNDRFHDALREDFDECFRWMQKRWAEFLPIQTPVTRISRHGLNRIKERFALRKSLNHRASYAVDTGTSPSELARRCGWADLSGAVSVPAC